MDGNIRDADAENMLREAVQIAFRGPAGEWLLRELEKMTIRTVGGPEVSSDVLRHMEGQRFIVSLLRNYRQAPLQGVPRVRAASEQSTPEQ